MRVFYLIKSRSGAKDSKLYINHRIRATARIIILRGNGTSRHKADRLKGQNVKLRWERRNLFVKLIFRKSGTRLTLPTH